MDHALKDTLHRIAQDAVRRTDPRDQTIAELRARLARERRSNADLAQANVVLRDLVAKGD